MGISPLPQGTRRLLGASASIATPESLTKELIENSLDAGADSVEIQISSDLLSKIQVRDNGVGIPVEDLDKLGRRSHTSKLTTFEQLQEGDCTTLGFRGDALAHANTIASISITTRTKGDPVGTKVDLDSDGGGVKRTQPVSAPVGTTVQALNLFERLPVRKQQHLKENRKPIAKIKDLLQAYALARPIVRFSLKVIGKAKEPWCYSPESEGTAQKAAVQLFGKVVSAQYVSTSAVGTPDQAGNSETAAGLAIEAILPRIDSQSVPKAGPFLSVNDRPISSKCGTGKKLVSIVKNHINEHSNSKQWASNMLLCIKVRCHPSKYDPNISPLKDEVMLVDEPAVLRLLDDLCKKLYQGAPGTLVPATPSEPAKRSLDAFESADEESRMADIVCREHRMAALLDTSRAGPDVTMRATPGVEDKAGNEPLEKKAVRIIMRVDMLRTTSDATDAACEEDVVWMDVPRPSIQSNPAPEPEKRFKLTQGGASILSQDIQRYFKPRQPAQELQFEIAEDETAMPETHDNRLSTPQIQRATRRPLRRLTEADLNEHRVEEQQDIESEHELSAEANQELDFPLRSAPRVDDLHNRDRLGQMHMLQGSNDANEANRYEMPMTHSPRVSYALQTPPGSGSVRRLRDARLAFHDTSGSNRRRERLQHEQLHVRSRTARGLGERLSLFSPQATNVRSPFRPHTRHSESAAKSHRPDAGSLSSARDSRDDDAQAAELLPDKNISPLAFVAQESEVQQEHRSRAAQLRLMQTPAPEPEESSETFHSAICKRPEVVEARHLGKTASPGAGRESLASLKEDPRRYFIKRQRSMMRSGRLKRLPSKGLPLESVGDGTRQLVTILSAQAALLSPTDFLEAGNNEDKGLISRLEAFGELDAIEERLRGIVQPWMAAKHPDAEVTYALRSIVKGKGISCDQ